jgi:hypothetical protein
MIEQLQKLKSKDGIGEIHHTFSEAAGVTSRLLFGNGLLPENATACDTKALLLLPSDSCISIMRGTTEFCTPQNIHAQTHTHTHTHISLRNSLKT